MHVKYGANGVHDIILYIACIYYNIIMSRKALYVSTKYIQYTSSHIAIYRKKEIYTVISIVTLLQGV